jgi:poly(3-hydroxybutyrate) depolymerase
VIYNVPANFPGEPPLTRLQHTGFVAMNPDRHATSHFDYFKDLIKGDTSVEAHRTFYDEYNAVDMDADYYLKPSAPYSRSSNWSMAPGSQTSRATEVVKLGDIKTTAVMTVEGELDDISGSGRTRAALECSGVDNAKKNYEVKGVATTASLRGRRCA